MPVSLQNFFLLFFGALTLAAAQIFFSQLLPWPWVALNLLAPAVVATIMRFESGSVVWGTLLAGYLLELYMATPFGLTMYSAVMATVVTYWLYAYLFTNRSRSTAITLTGIWLVCYRLLFTLALAWLAFFRPNSSLRSWRHLLVFYLWEFLLTIVFMAILSLRRRVRSPLVV